jgi:hypothetical protein
VVKLENSQLSGGFMMPVGAVTLTLGLYDETNIAIKEWLVADEASTVINIEPNHFYSLGVKHKVDATTGASTLDPSDDDEGFDMLQDEVATISISSNWGEVHNLVMQ